MSQTPYRNWNDGGRDFDDDRRRGRRYDEPERFRRDYSGHLENEDRSFLDESSRFRGRDPRFEERFEDWEQPRRFGAQRERRFERYGYFEPQRGEERSFAGRGPKNYRRSDQRIQEEVCERLTEDPQVDASEIQVSVRDGEITLEGTVAERRMKRIAEDCVESVAGVSQVHNRLRIEGSPQFGQTSSQRSQSGSEARSSQSRQSSRSIE